MLPARLLAVAGVAAALAACAHAASSSPTPDGAPASKNAAACALSGPDSLFLAGGPIYPTCAVDKKAKILSTPRFDFQLTRPPRGGGDCYRAEVAFAVNPDGTAERANARIVSTNDMEFGQTILETYVQQRYTPGMKDGVAVRQIQHETMKMAVSIVAVGAPRQRTRPSC